MLIKSKSHKKFETTKFIKSPLFYMISEKVKKKLNTTQKIQDKVILSSRLFITFNVK